MIVVILSLCWSCSLTEWRHVHRHGSTFHPRRLFDRPVVLELNRELIKEIAAQLRMRNRAPAEQHGELDLVAPIQEPGGLPSLGFQIVSADLRLNTNFLELRHMLISTRISLFSALLVSKFSVIH